jgi:hypothetical protein
MRPQRRETARRPRAGTVPPVDREPGRPPRLGTAAPARIKPARDNAATGVASDRHVGHRHALSQDFRRLTIEQPPRTCMPAHNTSEYLPWYRSRDWRGWLAYCVSPAASAEGGRMLSGGNTYKLSMSSCCASASTESCCTCAFSAIRFASSDARPPSCRTPISSISTWLTEKITMPSTRRAACSDEERAAPTGAASNGFAGCAVSLLRSPITHL